ncbi:transcriptional regulator, partial [Mesorhizobium sp. M2D.F.Ca.ET.145.01.1.1]
DVLAWNPAAAAVFGDYGLLEGDSRNIVHMVFTNPHHRRLLVDWEELARVVLASFRAESAKYVGDPDFDRLIALMMSSSPEFRDWWPRRDVARRLTGVKHVRHPKAGLMAFEHMSLSIDDGSDIDRKST